MGLIFKILIFLYLVNYAIGAVSCPEECKCIPSHPNMDSTAITVHCSYQDLLEIPEVPTTTHKLDLRYNEISDIAPGQFSQLHHLRILELNNNKLRRLCVGSFSGLNLLKSLNLYRNQIRFIQCTVFEDMNHLEELYLHQNEIHKIKPEIYRPLTNLRVLYLHHNNIKEIRDGTFQELKKLRKLRVDGNPLECEYSIAWMSHMLEKNRNLDITAVCNNLFDMETFSIGDPMDFD